MLPKKRYVFSIIIGEDCISHPDATKIATLAGYVEKYTDFKVSSNSNTNKYIGCK